MERIRHAIAWRIKPLRRRLNVLAAFLWRRMLVRTRFIAVTGSVGKTTTKELLRAILSRRAATVWSFGNDNLRRFGSPEATILRARPWHRFAVLEAGIERPGDMQSVAKLVKPDVGLVLDVKRCHTNAFKTIENIAAEKSELVRNLGPRSTAVLNADNPYVAMMAPLARGKVVTFSSAEGSQLRLLNASSQWPERLRLRIACDRQEYEIRTRLVGEHWSTAVLAALTTATTCGVPLQEAIAAVEEVEPFWARMQPVTVPSCGAIVIRDEWNGSIDTFEAAFKVMEHASAARKIVVLSDYSDTSTKLRSRASRLGRRAAQIAELVIFVGDYADRSVAAAISEGVGQDNARGFVTIRAALAFLKSELRDGDLVLLKGQANHHLSRLYLGLLGDIECTRLSCARQVLCDQCEYLGLSWQPAFQGVVATD